MGIYTNIVNESYGPAYATDYRDYEPYSTGENFHALGIRIAAESAANSNTFMKAIALEELACYEQTGSVDALYESVNVKGIFEKIKMIFKKIIDKVQKLFHTFIAKLRSLYMSGKDFAKKYRKEITINWSKVDSDWEFKGYKFDQTGITGIGTDKSAVTKDALKNNNDFSICFAKICVGSGDPAFDKINDFISACDPSNYTKVVKTMEKLTSIDSIAPNTTIKLSAGNTLAKEYDLDYLVDSNGKKLDDSVDINSHTAKVDGYYAKKKSEKNDITNVKHAISICRKELNDNEDKLRGLVVAVFDPSFTVKSLDSKEYNEELFKLFRNGEEDKEDLNKAAIDNIYGSISGLITFISDFDKYKGTLEKMQKNFVTSIDDIIKVVDKAQNTLVKDIKDNKDNKDTNEVYVALGSLYQTYWEKIKEYSVQFYAAQLTALKDSYSQARAIAVKTIGLNKKMTTNESYEYGSGSSFIDSIQIV